MSRLVLVGLCLAFAIACAGPAAQTTTDRARAIEREVWSPYCPGRLLIDCTTQQARELRTEIERRIERGDSTDEVLAWIRRNHGDEALASPGGGGTGLVVWLVPAAIFLAGAGVVSASIRRWTRASRTAKPTT
jgi:cytochrome c-type biogenesis protein CcmH/NrfF